MSFKAKNSKGETRVRRKPAVSVTMESNVLKDVDLLVEEWGLSRSEVVGYCVVLGLNVISKSRA